MHDARFIELRLSTSVGCSGIEWCPSGCRNSPVRWPPRPANGQSRSVVDMSICLMVKVPEGLVLAADSASSVQASPVKKGGDSGPAGVLKVFFNATKVFQIRDLPVGVLTWGSGSFRARTTASLVEEFENTDQVREIVAAKLDIRALVTQFWTFMGGKSGEIFPEIPTEGRPRSGFVICGYPGSDFFPEEYVTVVPTEAPKRLRPPVDGQPDFGANWYGVTDAIVRLHHGRDDRLFDVLRNSGMAAQQVDALRNGAVADLQYPVLFHAMPLGDAIDYAEFLVQTTINRFRFVMGAEICGGAIDIATVTRKYGFAWVRRKRRNSDAE